MFFNSEKPDTSEVQQEEMGGLELRRQITARVRSYNRIQVHCLLRLARLLTLRREHGNSLQVGDWRTKLLNKATYSTFCDCMEAGVGNDARTLFQQEGIERPR